MAKTRIQITNRRKAHIKRRDKHACVDCGSKFGLTIDHIIPIDKGGSNDDDNLQTLCATCNEKKGNVLMKLSFWKRLKMSFKMQNEMLNFQKEMRRETNNMKVAYENIKKKIEDFEKEYVNKKPIDKEKLSEYINKRVIDEQIKSLKLHNELKIEQNEQGEAIHYIYNKIQHEER